jgi:hypothetical protein
MTPVVLLSPWAVAASAPCGPWRAHLKIQAVTKIAEMGMKILSTLLVAAVMLSGCISSSSPPPTKTTVVVPPNSTTTVVCQDGTKPPC